jgi:hypothetical protein
MPFTVTEIPVIFVGNGNVVGATMPGRDVIPDPNTVASDPGVTPVRKLAAFTTPSAVIAGAPAGDQENASTGMVRDVQLAARILAER